MFEIIDDSLFTSDWVAHPTLPLELTKGGKVRNKITKVIYQPRTHSKGYIKIEGDLLLHRLLMETFNPIADSENFTVDHKNGIRNDNRLENLEWVLRPQNTQRMHSNQQEIMQAVQAMIQKRGYEYTLDILTKNL